MVGGNGAAGTPEGLPIFDPRNEKTFNNADGWFDLGFMYKENHENDKAIEALHNLSVQFPNTTWIDNQIAEYGRRRAAQGAGH